MVFKKVVKFLYCFIVRIRDFIKKLRYSKSKILTKLYCLLFLFYFFSIFGIFFFVFHIPKLVQKLWNFFVMFYWNGWRFYQRFLENSKSYFKKHIDMWNFFFKILRFTICFFYFIIIFEILFSVSSMCTWKKILEIFIFFYFTDYRFYQRLLENSWIFIKKNRDTLNTKHF